MTNNKIIYKAVLKAEANGYKSADTQYFLDNNLWEMIIFDIDFAKAFFGVEKIPIPLYDDGILEKNDMYYRDVPTKWESHLSQMVILEENERIKYLEKFL